MKRLWSILLIVLFVSGCATTKISFGTQSTLLKIGMDKDEVKVILGSPKTTSVRTSQDGIVEKWSYWNKTMIGYIAVDDPNLAGSADRLTVTFKNDVVQSWGDQLDYSNMMEQSAQIMQNAMKNMPPIEVEQTIYQGQGKSKEERNIITIVTKEVVARLCPNPNCGENQHLKRIPEGTILDVEGEMTVDNKFMKVKWFEVTYKGVKGWVSSFDTNRAQ